MRVNPVKGFLQIPFHFVALMCYPSVAGAGTASLKSSVAIPSSKAQEFLAKLSRSKRNIWDRSRPDVQQWIIQFLYMGFDEEVGVSGPQEYWSLVCDIGILCYTLDLLMLFVILEVKIKICTSIQPIIVNSIVFLD